MVDDKLVAYVLELRMLMHVLWKIHVMTQEQHLSVLKGALVCFKWAFCGCCFMRGS
jgi:hypothetical protein